MGLLSLGMAALITVGTTILLLTMPEETPAPEVIATLEEVAVLPTNTLPPTEPAAAIIQSVNENLLPTLSADEKRVLLGDAELMGRLHRMVWQIADEKRAARWGIPS